MLFFVIPIVQGRCWCLCWWIVYLGLIFLCDFDDFDDLGLLLMLIVVIPMILRPLLELILVD